jgi:biopolymer transport protein ExbD
VEDASVELYRRRRIDAHIDMTPMVDTLLQLFMIFLLSASFVASNVRLTLPRAALERRATAEPLVVSLDAADNLYVNSRPVARENLKSVMHTLLEGVDNRTVLLRADRTAPYERVLAVMVDIQAGGATNIVLASDLRNKS